MGEFNNNLSVSVPNECSNDDTFNEQMDVMHPVQKYFIYDSENDSSLCLHCQKGYKGKHSSNLLRHLESKHKEVYKKIQPDIITFFEKKNIRKSKPPAPNPNVITVKYDLDVLKKSFVTFCTIDARPYSIFGDEGMNGILKPIHDACDHAGLRFRINRHNIRKHCESDELRLRAIIAEETRVKMVTVQMDIVTVLDR